MTWTYGGDPAANTRDEVRFLVGDTDSTDTQVTDAEISWALADASNTTLAAAQIAEAIAAKYARFVSKSVGDLSIQYAQRQQHYAELAARLKAKGSRRGVVPYAGGISQADKETQEDDSDRVQPSFTKGMHDGDASDGGNTDNAT